MNWITKQIEEFIADIILNFIEFFQNQVVNAFETGTKFAEEAEIVGAIRAATLIACALVVVMVSKEIINTYMFETNGDPDGDPMQVLVKATQSICLICCNDIIFDCMTKLSTLMATDMNAAITPKKIFVETQTHITNLVADATGGIIASILFIIVYLVFTVMLAIKAGIRGVELALMKILFPFFAVDNITVSGERWNAFFSSYMVTFFGYIIQLITFNMSSINFVKGLTGSSSNYLIAMAWMYMSLNTPRWLEKFAYSSGISKTARGGLSGTMQLVNLLRMRTA